MNYNTPWGGGVGDFKYFWQFILLPLRGWGWAALSTFGNLYYYPSGGGGGRL